MNFERAWERTESGIVTFTFLAVFFFQSFPFTSMIISEFLPLLESMVMDAIEKLVIVNRVEIAIRLEIGTLPSLLTHHRQTSE